ncbi:MAG: phosphoribosylformylglycinamidine synthase subunit PurL [Planctomycetota bacterium]|nr:phosphoribosylformylglycinamidine synthase subunit PurL [Planctomycetota bacterium]
MQAWCIELLVKPGVADPAGNAAQRELTALGLPIDSVRSRRGYLLAAELGREQVETIASSVLADPVLDIVEITEPGAQSAATPDGARRISVLLRPGVTDPVAHSVQKAIRDLGLPDVEAATFRAYDVYGSVEPDALLAATRTALSNSVINDLRADERPGSLPGPGGTTDLGTHPVELSSLDRAGLEQLSEKGGLALDGEEMLAIQEHFRALGRAPHQLELETLAQTWSEHCKHKTLTGTVRFEGQVIENLLKSTIAKVTHDLDRDFCVSVFVDNAGIITFDEEDSVCIKVETHNRPSAIEPFGGAGTGVGGVIRDVLGTGLGARPVASTDVFCFAPPDLPATDVPAGCLHPLTVMQGVVAGVRDYGNPMGIPTVGGSIHFDEDFVGNPLVYVGNIGILPTSRAHKKPNAGDVIVVFGGRTGRDGIHGATFSSLELHTDSEMISSGAVQIGDPITERKVMDAVLAAADEDLFSAITDCGAGGFSSAIGEMAEGLGAEVQLQDAPLKYQGLSPWEIWISEAQERMVLAVPPEKLDRILEVCATESCEATVLGKFEETGRLVVKHGDVVHADLDLEFLHDGLPSRELEARYVPPELTEPDLPPEQDCAAALLAALSDYSVCSKEWVVRQYDHEVQAGSAGKPFCGPENDGPTDAAIIAPKLGSKRGVVLSNGLNPRYSKIDPAAMAECALDEAMRNLTACGGDPDYTAILDNYCWGNTRNPERLGELVRATLAVTDLAKHYRTPFVSGKDSLHNEFRAADRTITIPGCILITAMSIIPDITRTVTSDLKRSGSRLVLVGVTRNELGGSVYYKTKGELGKNVPRVDHDLGKQVLQGVSRAIAAGCVLSAHDCSEGGLAVAATEMALGGRLGLNVALDKVPLSESLRDEQILFSESQSRILLEVAEDRLADLEANLDKTPHAVIGTVESTSSVDFHNAGKSICNVSLREAEQAFKRPLDLDQTLVKGGQS